MTLQPNVTSQPTQSWQPCTFQGHLDEVRIRHEDIDAHPSDRDAQTALREAVGLLLDHLDGKHQDECRVWALTPLDELELRGSNVRVVQEPDRYERERMGVWE